MSSPVRGSVEDAGSAEWLDEDELEALDDVVLPELTVAVELLVEGLVVGAVEELEDELEDVVLGADGWVVVELEW